MVVQMGHEAAWRLHANDEGNSNKNDENTGQKKRQTSRSIRRKHSVAVLIATNHSRKFTVSQRNICRYKHRMPTQISF